VIKASNFGWHWSLCEAPWEWKVSSLLDYVSNPEDKATVVLEALKKAPVPWSSTIQAMYSIGANIKGAGNAPTLIR